VLPLRALQLDASEEILRRRMQGVEAAELEAFRASTPVTEKSERNCGFGRI